MGKQISKWIGNGRTKANYYCPKEISSVFYWRVFWMNVLNKILKENIIFYLTFKYYRRKILGNKIIRRKGYL